MLDTAIPIYECGLHTHAYTRRHIGKYGSRDSYEQRVTEGVEGMTDVLRRFLRTKPFVIGVGLEKCGTSSLYDYLAQSYSVSAPWPKELEFFSSNYSKGLIWFLGHYDIQKTVLLDITPSYHWRVEYMERALDAAPNAAVVLLLRSPMARAYSAYVHRLNWFFESCYRNGQCDGYNTTFQDVISARDKYIFPSYWSLIKRIESIFGDRLLVISWKT